MIALTNDMLTGIEKVDEQHKELVNRINAVASMGTSSVSDEETKKTINFLGEYIIKHFSYEESLQRKSHYKEYELHKEQHKIYISEFKKLKEEFAAHGHSPAFTVKLNTSIINWIVKHIKSLDVEFGKFYKEQNT
jgi:hemerythrin